MFNINSGRRRAVFGIAGAALLSLTLAACGEQEDGGDTPGAGPSVSADADSALAAKVPDAIKSDGKIVVGTDSSYAPAEFLDPDGKTVVGFDVELFTAVAAKLGLKAEFVSANFGDIITGVNTSKYEVGVSSFTINDERKGQANMVSYYQVGTQWVTKKGNPAGVTIDNACGKKIAVQRDTVQVDDITAGRRPAPTAASRRSPSSSSRARTRRPPRWSPVRTTRCSPTTRSGCTPSPSPTTSSNCWTRCTTRPRTAT